MGELVTYRGGYIDYALAANEGDGDVTPLVMPSIVEPDRCEPAANAEPATADGVTPYRMPGIVEKPTREELVTASGIVRLVMPAIVPEAPCERLVTAEGITRLVMPAICPEA